MHNPFDQLAKKVGKSALDASGVTLVQYEIARDAQHADGELEDGLAGRRDATDASTAVSAS